MTKIIRHFVTGSTLKVAEDAINSYLLFYLFKVKVKVGPPFATFLSLFAEFYGKTKLLYTVI